MGASGSNSSGGGSSGTTAAVASYSDVIVFVVGGGTYAEYQNILESVKAHPLLAGKTVTYGATELLNAHDMLKQLHQLGEDSK